jgi:hypothetical protein
MRGDGFVIIAVFVGIPWVLGWIFRSHLSHQRYMKVLQLKAEANSRLLDRFGQDPALLEFLKGDAQHHLFDVQLPDMAPKMPAPYMRMLTAIQISLLLLAAGFSCLFIRRYLHYNSDQVGFLFLGTLGVALGIASLLSASAAFVVARLSRSLQAREQLDARS